MRSFAGVGDRFLKEMATDEGTRFRGAIMPASDQEGSPFEFSAPRLILRTRVEAEVHAGVIFKSPGGPRYLVGEHYAVENDYRSWRLFQIERKYLWARTIEATDQLTGLKKATATPQPLGELWGCVEFDRRMFTDPGLRLKTERVTVITNLPVKVGDTLDGQLVTRVTTDLGLYIIEHQ